MSSGNDIVVGLEERSVLRKGLKQLRVEGKIPAVVHDHGKQSIHVMANHADLVKAYSQAGKHHPVQLQLGKTNHLALIKDVDYEPVRHQLRHVVFQAIKQNEAVEAEVPVVFKADTVIPAEKISLMVLKQLDHVSVKALPKDLPDELVVDPTKLAEVGDHLTVADIEVPAGVTILTDAEHQIAIVEMPKDQEAEANAAAAEMVAEAGQSTEESTTTPADSTAGSDKTSSEA